MLYTYQCNGKCGCEFDELRSYKERNNVFCCGVKASKLICLEPIVFNETRDYSFTTNFGGRSVKINGRSHYKSLLKQHGLADATIKECMSVKPKKQSNFKRKEVVRAIGKQLRSEGILGHVPGFMKDAVKMKIDKK